MLEVFFVGAFCTLWARGRTGCVSIVDTRVGLGHRGPGATGSHLIAMSLGGHGGLECAAFALEYRGPSGRCQWVRWLRYVA